MATLEFFNVVRAEAGAGGEVWLHGEDGEAGLHVRFPAGGDVVASRIVGAINGLRESRRDVALPPARELPTGTRRAL